MMDKDWIINALKLEWIESDRIVFKIGLDSLLNQFNYQSFLGCLSISHKPWIYQFDYHSRIKSDVFDS